MTKKEIAIIDLIVKENNGLSLAEIVDATEFSKTTTYRNLENLVDEKILYKANKKYYVGSVMLRWMNSREHRQDLIRILDPHLDRLVKELDETIHLVQLQGDDRAVYIRKLKHSGSIQMKSQVGQELPLYCTGAGRAILALFPDEKLDDYFKNLRKLPKFTSKTETNKSKLKEYIINSRKTGFTTEIEQNEDNIQCVGVAFEYGGFILSISAVTTILLPKKNFDEIGHVLCRVKQEILDEIK